MQQQYKNSSTCNASLGKSSVIVRRHTSSDKDFEHIDNKNILPAKSTEKVLATIVSSAEKRSVSILIFDNRYFI